MERKDAKTTCTVCNDGWYRVDGTCKGKTLYFYLTLSHGLDKRVQQLKNVIRHHFAF